MEPRGLRPAVGRDGRGMTVSGINPTVPWKTHSARYIVTGTIFRRSVKYVEPTVKRGDIFYADLSPVVGSEQGGVRPVLIVQNDTGNRHSPTVIAAAITSQTGKARLPTHISLAAMRCGLPKDSIILLEQVRTLDKRRLRERMGRVDEAVMKQVDGAIAVSLGLTTPTLI